MSPLRRGKVSTINDESPLCPSARFKGVSWRLWLIGVTVISVTHQAWAAPRGETICPSQNPKVAERPERSNVPTTPRDMSLAFERAKHWVLSVGSGEQVTRPRKRGGTKQVFKNNQSGSGVIWGDERWILTNAHILDGGPVLRAKTFERQIVKLEVVGVYRPLDIALLKPQDPEALKGLKSACYATATPRPGMWVAAVGHPYSMPYSLSTGAVSALERGELLPEWARSFPGFIQSDLTLNPGNSGGPLIDERGVMLGLNTAIHGSGVGMSFALPLSRLLPVIEQIKRTGEFKRSYVGLKLSKMSYRRGERASLPPRSGVRVRRVTDGGPAQLAGLRNDDIILSINGKPTHHHHTLSWQMVATPADTSMILEVLRLPHPPQLLYINLIPQSISAKTAPASPPGAPDP